MSVDINEAQVYVGTYAKYNDGSIEGAWLELSDYEDKDEFLKACRVVHYDEYEPELMFQDWENVPDGLIGESWLSEDFFRLRNYACRLSNDEQEAFQAWIDDCPFNMSESPEALLGTFRECYTGYYDSEEAFAEHLIENCYALSDFEREYFDYERFTSDLFITDYTYLDGYVFRNK